MRPVATVILSGLASAALCRAGDPQSIARFSNNDRLGGSMESLSPDMLVWKSPVLEQPTRFFLKNVLDLTLPGTMPADAADHEATVTLTNGDIVRGRLASVTDAAVSLDTWFGGRMDFNRLMVSGLKIDARSTYLYRGPTGLDGWKQSEDKPAWTFGGSAFRSHASGGISRDGVLPEECLVAFDAAWKGDALGLKIVLFSSDPNSDSPTSGYEISFQRGSIYLRNCRTQSFLGSARSQALLENDKVRVEIRASTKSGKVCLTVNDRVVEVWTDPDFGKGKFGQCLQFISLNTLPMRISGIGVASWDGLVDRMPDPRAGMFRQFGLQGLENNNKPAPPPKVEEGRMELANGDTLAGEVASIADGMINVKTPLGEIKLPVSRLRTVALKKVDLERCIRRNGDVRAWLPDDSSIVFRLDTVEDGKIKGSSQNFGTATFRIDAFSRIEFNIYDPELDDKRSRDDW